MPQLLVEIPRFKDPLHPVHQGLQNCPFLTRIVIGQLVEISVDVCWFPVYFLTEAAIGPSKTQDVKKGQLIIRFSFHGELDPRVNTIEVCQKPAEFIIFVVPDDNRIINVCLLYTSRCV